MLPAKWWPKCEFSTWSNCIPPRPAGTFAAPLSEAGEPVEPRGSRLKWAPDSTLSPASPFRATLAGANVVGPLLRDEGPLMLLAGDKLLVSSVLEFVLARASRLDNT